jgi:hypothetical protein
MRLRPPSASHLCICTKEAEPGLTNTTHAGVFRLRRRREQ